MTLDKNVTEMLAKARRFAVMGSIQPMVYSLQIAQEYADMTGYEISAGREKIEALGYDNAIRMELQTAREFARTGRYFESSLALAKIYAERRNRDVNEEIEAIRHSA